MNICFISRRFFPAISGMSSYALNLVNSMRDRGHRVTAISQYRRPSDRNVYRDGPPQQVMGVEVFGMPQLGEGTNGDFEQDIDALVKKIVELDATEKFDILHAQFAYPPGIAALLAGKALKKPVVVSIQGGDGHWFGTCCNYHRQLMKTLLRNSQALIIGTASFAQEVRENNNEDPKFVILPGATNVEQFHSWNSRQRANMREKYGIPVAKRVILSHGRLDWRKGIGELLEAFVLLHERDKEIHLVFAGVGPDEDALQARVRDMNLVPYISFLGYVDYADTPEVYALGDIFCSPTYAEGFSNTIVEALASGLPVVSTNVVGVRDVLVDGETALLVEARDPKSLEAVLRTLLDDDTTRNRLINNGHEAVNRLWSWKNLAMKLEQVYSSVRTQIPQHSWSLDSCGNPKAEPCRFREAPNLL